MNVGAEIGGSRASTRPPWDGRERPGADSPSSLQEDLYRESLPTLAQLRCLCPTPSYEDGHPMQRLEDPGPCRPM